MNILFLTAWYPTPDHVYAGIFVREHAKAVRAAGHRVVVVHLTGACDDVRRPWSIEQVDDLEVTDGILTYRVAHRRLPPRTSSPLYVGSAFAAYQRLRAQSFRPDVIHAHIYAPGVPAVILGSLFNHPVVITEQFSGFPRRTLNRAEVAKARFAFRRAAFVLPVSNHLKQAIAAYRIKARFIVVPNVVDTEMFQAGGRARANAGAKLLFVGNLDSNHSKGFPTLVEALRLLRERRSDWRLDVVGAGPERENYEVDVEDRGLSDFVVFHGAVAKSKVAALMRRADALVLPSRFDNMPSAVLEAMASGLPVVATDVGGIPEMVDKSSGILVPSQQPDPLALALDDLLSRRADFDSDAIAATARAKYGHVAVGERLTEIYRSACHAVEGR